MVALELETESLAVTLTVLLLQKIVPAAEPERKTRVGWEEAGAREEGRGQASHLSGPDVAWQLWEAIKRLS